jgi:hypothetical protein
MFKNRLFDILMALAFVAAVGFTIRTAVTPDQLVPSSPDFSDYSLRHPSTAISDNAQMTGTYLQGMQGLRQPGTAISVNAADLSDYFQRHSVTAISVNAAAVNVRFPGKEQDDIVAADLSDYFQRHSGSTIAIVAVASDWFERHPGVLNVANAVDLSDYFQRHPTALKLGGDADAIEAKPQDIVWSGRGTYAPYFSPSMRGPGR